MKNTTRSKLNNILNLDYSEKEKIGLTNQATLRKLVGILGVLLPILLFAGLYIDTGHHSPLPSISHYYFTRVNPVFVIVVSLMAIFLLIYKGKEPIDFFLSAAAGIFALCLVLFPTTNLEVACCDGTQETYAVAFLKVSKFRSLFHYISAAIFLLSLAGMSLFLFTRSDKPAAARTKNKKRRNLIYIACGVVMILSLLVVFAGYLKIISPVFYDSHNLTFWMEAMAVESFGISWLVKGEMVLKD